MPSPQTPGANAAGLIRRNEPAPSAGWPRTAFWQARQPDREASGRPQFIFFAKLMTREEVESILGPPNDIQARLSLEKLAQEKPETERTQLVKAALEGRKTNGELW